ncbi:MAG: 30S ribosomal protein S13 [Endomicrobium sp.]|nr:30S ribosomal protein S13 [Endomicrobium sp.]
MARVSGVDLPKNKKLGIALRYIYGIGPSISNEIVAALSLDFKKKISDLTDEEVNKINNLISTNLKVEGDLRRETQANIKRLVDIGSYRGSRHRKNLPVRGQRSRTNARTRRGKRKTIGAGNKAVPGKKK